jgi:hypothetical protein
MLRERTFKPGDVANETGVYLVSHDRHRLPHEVIVLRGERFPRCANCSEAVIFELFYAAPFLSSSYKEVLPALDDEANAHSALSS